MKRNLLAILIIVVGSSLMLASLNIGPARTLFDQLWPAFIVLVGLIQLVDRRRGDWWPFIILLVGTLLLLNNLADLPFNFWDAFWPAIVILAGVAMLLKSTDNKTTEASHRDNNITAVLSGVDTKITSENYTQGSATAVMGGIELNLSKAVIKKEATLSVFALMGGVELRVPENVVVKNRASCILGGIEDKSAPVSSSNAPVLYIDGTVIMGGIEVKR